MIRIDSLSSVARAFSALAGLALASSVGCDGRARPASGGGGGATADEPRSGPSIAVLDLSDGVPEETSGGLLGLSPRSASFDDLVQRVDRLARDKDLRGVLVRLGTAHVGLARATEIGGLLAGLGGKVPVWCHADDYSNGTIYLAARGCKRVWASPATSVDAIGIAAQTLYFHKLLTDELGLDVDFLQVGKFKGAEEPFTRDGPSPEARASLESTLADIRGAWLDGIRQGRPSAPATAPEDGPYSAPQAKERGLVDDVGYFDEARDALEKTSGAVRAEVRLGTGEPDADGDDLADLLRAVAGESLGAAPIALVRATGAISMDGGGLLGGGGNGIVAHRLARTLAHLERDDDVKAVVLRIDSPGGSALASDLLWHDLMRIRAKKPLVVSVGDMAASGGYYLASSASVVFADDTSIVGSIGVVGGKVAAGRALERIGVHAQTFPAKSGDPNAASRAAYESLLTPWDDATRTRVLGTMTGIYDLFLARIAEGRKIPVERVAESAEGRIFSGREGKARGLVDEIGGLREAIARARALAGLGDDARVAPVEEAGGLLHALADDGAAGQGGRRAGIEAMVRRAAPDLVPFIQSMAPLAGDERALVALPFALTLR